ncbi:MAG: ribosome assembly RNA-binding protein YhbY [Firmicutes bacterium]|nr:ribosome assembly RNA-binding protein YhbY [Bacillota bacterium]
MLTSKQRAYLRSLGNELEPIVQVGKGGLSPNLITQVDEALEARELLKVRVLKNALADVRDVAEELAEETDADVVQVIGNIIMLYREASKDPQIILP